MICRNCGHDTPHEASLCEPGITYCEVDGCLCTGEAMNAAEKGYREGAEEALRRVGESGERFYHSILPGETTLKAIRTCVERVRREMGLTE